MKIKIINTVFLVLSILTLLVGLFSFTHEHNNLDSVSIILGSITYYLTYLTLARQYPESTKTRNSKNSTQYIRISYLITFFLFLLVAVASYTMDDSLMGSSTFFLCAVTQLIGYRMFMKETDERYEESE